jgi:sulfur-oxidizing protein SoxZ
MASALINVPAKAKRGDIIEIKTLMSHIMETGYRLFPAISANPFITFFTTATESGKFEFEWVGDQGFSETASASITVG